MKSESTAQFEAVPLEQVLGAVHAAGKLGLVMLDACRNDPFSATMTRSNGTRAVSRGGWPRYRLKVRRDFDLVRHRGWQDGG